MIFHNYDIAKEYLRRGGRINFYDSFDLAKLASQLLSEPETEKDGRDLVIRVKEAITKDWVDVRTLPMWNEMVVSAGLFPYVELDDLNHASQLQLLTHQSDNMPGYFFHQEQLEVSMALQQGEAVILSAPTSYGKSLLIEDVVASGTYRNIVIVQPTLALLDETRKKLSKYRKQYKVIVSTSQDPDQNRGNIFLFTGERVVEYDRFPKVDFFVIDEFYKLSMDREDDRAIALNHAFYKLRKFTPVFYMLGPSIKSIPEKVLSQLNARWIRTDYATVAVDEQVVPPPGSGRKTKEVRRDHLFTLLPQMPDPTLIYVASPGTATDLALEFINTWSIHKKGYNQLEPPEIAQMCEWVSKHIHNGWSLIDALKNGIGFHHGGLPRHLGGSIVDAFNKGYIRYLFCTATLIEGVNTSAKNVILFDDKKATKAIDFFDYKNIAGRSGRMRQHFIGNVFNLHNQPPTLDFEVDIPILSQDDAPVEILMAIDSQDIKPEVKSKLEKINAMPEELRALMKKHSTVSIEGQLALVADLQENALTYRKDLVWNSAYPTYDQLAAVTELAWNYLAKDEDRRFRVAGLRKLSPRWLAGFAFGYHRFQSLGALISDNVNNNPVFSSMFPDYGKRVDGVAFSILQIARNYFDYKLPKWLSIVSGLQQYVYTSIGMSGGDYTAFASRLENGFLDPALAALREYDIPLTAIRKMGRLLEGHRTPEENIAAINRLSNQQLQSYGLLDYEIVKLRQAQ